MVVGISGKAGSGKDTVGRILQSYASNYEIKKFADKLKDLVCILIGCSREQLEDQDFKSKELGEDWKVFRNKLHQYPFLTWEEAFEAVIEWDADETYIEEEILTPRKILQLLSTECCREILHPNIWVNALFANYTEQSDWIITDMRFPNELKAVKDKGGITIRVNRDVGDTGNHPSETALDEAEFDYVLDNNGTIEELEAQIAHLKED